jgi:hypothetical protein
LQSLSLNLERDIVQKSNPNQHNLWRPFWSLEPSQDRCIKFCKLFIVFPKPLASFLLLNLDFGGRFFQKNRVAFEHHLFNLDKVWFVAKNVFSFEDKVFDEMRLLSEKLHSQRFCIVGGKQDVQKVFLEIRYWTLFRQVQCMYYRICLIFAYDVLWIFNQCENSLAYFCPLFWVVSQNLW